MESDPAPALTRGLVLLQRLEADGQCSLEQLAGASGFPKTSVLRLLTSLEAAGAVARDPVSKRYRARLRLVSCESEVGAGWHDLAARLPGLAEASGATAELFTWDGRHLVLVDRAEPEGAAVSIVARIGFVRDLSEFDALTQVCRAWGGLRRRRHWAYDERARRRELSEAEAETILAATRERGYGADLAANSNGVIRHAAPILDTAGRLRGALALARTGPRHDDDGPTVRVASASETPTTR